MANINVTHLDTNKLHPVYVQYDGQLTPQPAFIEHDTRDNTLVAGYSGEIGGGVPEDVWNGKRRRYKINIDLTENEINTLLDEVGLMLSNDVEADVEQVCEFRITDSHGIYDVADWMQGIDPCDEYGITADSTDDDLETIGAAMVDYATGEGCTITGVSDYCKQLRDDLRRSKEQ
jgi:hypothetical protein